ncbi:DNA cytosine methyltransferase [Paenibacillus prosopidis]|uniref:DNA (cytosine-5-)-methyltransferase n=1 Tax=Paenibacillus prosopidis TaxID=630520 RepID=A0A368VJV4_9BACL|nr:DNA cytosine methyltransferase [Paenibacillus prosopidis]RCW41608.1 site-specific DNA-cytosine methylase [Paenibacillus prosopidis]
MKDVKLIRHIMTGFHRENTRIWLEPTVLEAAGFDVGEGVRQTIKDGAIILTRCEQKTRIISKRKRPSWAHERPLYESCSKEVTLVFREREYIDLLVSDGIIVIKKERSFDLFVVEKPTLQGGDLKKLRLNSFPCGGGFATACLAETGLFEPVGALDIWPTAVDAYMNNFRNGSAYIGDLTKKHPSYVAPSDVCWLSPSCTRYSSLGGQDGGVTEGHGPHYARLVLASGASVVMIEQVPQYFKSTSYKHLKKLLQPFFPYMHEIIIDAFDLGSVASRTRGYAAFFQEKTDFEWPEIPKLPEHRRKTVAQVIGKDWEEGDWRPISGTVMEGLLRKVGNNNFKAEKNHTLVGLDSKRVSAFPFSYGKVQVTSSYLKHPDKEMWRMFRSDEMLRFQMIPEWYQFPEYMGEGERIKLIGQSIAGDVVKAFGIEVAVAIMGSRYKRMASIFPTKTDVMETIERIEITEENGQGVFQFDSIFAS